MDTTQVSQGDTAPDARCELAESERTRNPASLHAAAREASANATLKVDATQVRKRATLRERRRAPQPTRPKEPLLSGVIHYPGGKRRLVAAILDHLRARSARDDSFTFVEPFVGGGVVVANVLSRFPNATAILNDLDPDIAALHDVLARGDSASLTRQVADLEPSLETWCALQEDRSDEPVRRAVRAVFFSRTNYGAVQKANPIFPKREPVRRLDRKRWQTDRIIAELTARAELYRARGVEVTNLDYEDVLAPHLGEPTAFVYLDPPYYGTSERVYRATLDLSDYQRMASLLRDAKCPWLLSHDDHPQVVALFDGWCAFEDFTVFKPLPPKASDKRRELLISPLPVYPKRTSHARTADRLTERGTPAHTVDQRSTGSDARAPPVETREQSPSECGLDGQPRGSLMIRERSDHGLN